MMGDYEGRPDVYPGEHAPVDAALAGLREEQPRVLLMGLKKSGKTSIQKVVFHKASPHETVLLETSTKLQKEAITHNTFVQFQIWDFPGQLMDLFDEEESEAALDWEKVFAASGAIVYVIDCADKWPPAEAVKRLVQTIVRVETSTSETKPKNFEIFIHKVDCLKSEQSQEKHHDVKTYVEEELTIAIEERKNHDPNLENFDTKTFLGTKVHYHMTSIYDHSIFDAFSKVVQRVIGHLHDNVTALLDMLASRSGMEKAFLFDVVSKIYVAQDEHELTNHMYEVCFDMIDVTIDISQIYGCQLTAPHDEEGTSEGDEASQMLTVEQYERDHSEAQSIQFDSESCSVIRLDSKQVLYLHEVDKYLALVCLLREESFKKIGLINYNVLQFKKLIKEMFEVQKGFARAKREHPTPSVQAPTSTAAPPGAHPE